MTSLTGSNTQPAAAMDLILQTSTQSHCHRIVQYFQDRQQQHLFPAGTTFADAAEELGPLGSHTNGPCLVLFSNMQLSPEAFNAWFVGHVVERPCCRLYWLERSIPAEPDTESLVKAIIAAGVPVGLTGVRLDGYPKSQEVPIGDALLDAGYPAPTDPKTYSHVLFVVRMPDTGLWRWSYMERQHLWRQKCDEPAKFNKSVATAIYKIAEVMQVLGLTQQQQQQEQQQQASCQQQHISNGLAAPDRAGQDKQQDLQQIQQLQQLRIGAAAHTNGIQQQHQQPMRWAIDVGACPGGWTSYLADSCGYSVIAIDPAELHPDVSARPNVHFIRAKAADALQQVQELLQGRQADLLVCDANDHVKCLPTFLGPVLPLLRPGGDVVLTLKYYGRGPKKGDVAGKLAELLPDLEAGTVLWLLANTLCERTYVTRKK